MAATCTAERAAPRFAIRPDSLAASIAMLLGMNMVQRAVGFGRSVLMCRWLPPEQLGHWDLALAFFELVPMVAVLSIPSCFARYLESYRQRDQLRMFLRRTLLAVAALTIVSLGVAWAAQAQFAQAMFGSAAELGLARLAIAVLPALVLFNTLQLLFNAMRMFRVLFSMQFVQSMLFALLAIGLVSQWQPHAGSVVIAYAAASLLCSLVPLYWLTRMWISLPGDRGGPAFVPFWGKMMTFVLAVCASNVLTSVITASDRYMILHFSAVPGDQAAAMVGQFHSARLVPVVIIQLTVLMGTMFVPYLTADWEAGRSDRVATRINTFVKLIGLGTMALSAVVLLGAPLLFGHVLGGKFPEGQAILPWTLLCAVWFSMYSTTKAYFWCDERVRLVNLGLVLALLVDVAANFLLLPRWGLHGAALASSLANLTLLLSAYGLTAWRGMRIERGTWLVTAAPLSLYLGVTGVCLTLVGLAIACVSTDWIFDRQERRQIAAFAQGRLERLRQIRERWRRGPEPAESISNEAGI